MDLRAHAYKVLQICELDLQLEACLKHIYPLSHIFRVPYMSLSSKRVGYYEIFSDIPLLESNTYDLYLLFYCNT